MKYNAFLHNDALLYPVTRNIIDVFHGKGWEKQTRFRRIKGKWVYARGFRADPSILKGADL